LNRRWLGYGHPLRPFLATFQGLSFRSEAEAEAELEAVMSVVSHIAKKLDATITTTYENRKE